MRREEGVGDLEPKHWCTKKWPKSIFPFVNFNFPTMKSGSRGGYPPCSKNRQPFYNIPGRRRRGGGVLLSDHTEALLGGGKREGAWRASHDLAFDEIPSKAAPPCHSNTALADRPVAQ